MCDEMTKSENVSASRKRGDAITASPRPWRLDDSDTIRDANGCVVVSALNPCGRKTRRLIVEAVNDEVSWRDGYIKARTERNAFLGQCDRLRDLARRLADNLANYHIVGERERALLREARTAIGEGDKARPAAVPLGRPATEEEVDGGKAQWCQACVAKCPLAGRDALAVCERFEEGSAR